MAMNAVYFDHVKKEVYGGKTEDLVIDPRGIGWVVFDAMKNWRNQNLNAQINAKSGEQDSYKSLLIRCIRTACAMKYLGIKKGDIISICSYNHLNSVVPLLAGYFVGAIVAPTDPSISVEDNKLLLSMVKPKLIFVSSGSENLIESCLEDAKFHCEIITFKENDANSKYRSFDWFLRKQDCEDDFLPEACDDPNDTCSILFSSGTTGLPKGICLNHNFLLKTIVGFTTMKIPIETFFGLASLYWVSATIIVVGSIYLGKQRLIVDSFQADVLWEYIDKFKVDYIFIAPVHAIKAIPYFCGKGRKLKYMAIAGGPIQPEYLQQLRDALPETFISCVYGQTEVGFISALREKDRNYSKLGTVGLPVPGLRIRIVDPDTEQLLGLNQVGEIRVKSTCPINGYYKMCSTDIWDKDGFNRTGDLGYFDEDLCLFVTDRIKEMFKYMSWHIVPAKLEMILQNHPEVRMAVVVGVPHPTDDNHALGIVSLVPNAKVTENELEKFVEERVDDRNRLRAGVLVYKGDMPLTPTAKINRRLLKSQVKNMNLVKILT